MMGIPYLKSLQWSRWSREERYFCAILYSWASRDPVDFAQWLIRETKLDLEDAGDWDVGYEVCFYRDYLWRLGKSAKEKNLPTKRTFDLCLFGERALIIIEAKVYEGFDTKQNMDFGCDEKHINSLDGLKDVKVRTVALASSKYKPRADTLDVFDNHIICWAQIAQKYPEEPLFLQADQLYKQKPGAFALL